MPFRSKKQQRFMFSTMPQMAKEWAQETDFSKLPEKVRKKKPSGKKDRNDVFQGPESLEAHGDKIDKVLELASEFERQAKSLKP